MTDRAAAVAAAFERAVRWIALAGGFLLIAVIAMTVVSVAGRYLFSVPIPGDYEITELACGVAVFAFFPYCHLRGANIVAEFFTTRLSSRAKWRLDSFHNLAFAVCAGVIAWRLVVGGLHKMADGQTTLYLEIPVYWGYFPAVVGAVTLVLAAAWVFVRHARGWAE